MENLEQVVRAALEDWRQYHPRSFEEMVEKVVHAVEKQQSEKSNG